MVNLILRIIDIVSGTLGLLLILRVILHIFRLSNQHPIWRVVKAVTDPIINGAKRILGMPSTPSIYISTPAINFDILHPLIALIVVWVLRTIFVWIAGLGTLIPVWINAPIANLGDILRYILRITFSLYTNALFLRIILQWLQVPYSSRVMRFLWDITEPVLTPIRQILPPMMGIDFSPIVAFILLRLLEGVLISLLSWIF